MKEKRPPRNKFKDGIWDYYQTNKEISRQYEEARKAEGKKEPEGLKNLRGNEKLYLGVIGIGLVLLIVKYAFF